MLCCHPPVYSSSDDWICLGLDARINPNPNPRRNPLGWRKRYLSSFQVTLVAFATARRRFCNPSLFLSGDKETLEADIFLREHLFESKADVGASKTYPQKVGTTCKILS